MSHRSTFKLVQTRDLGTRLRKAWATQQARLKLEYLPPYAPELNPIEYVWSYVKRNPLAHRPVLDLGTLARTARSLGPLDGAPALVAPRLIPARAPFVSSEIGHYLFNYQ